MNEIKKMIPTTTSNLRIQSDAILMPDNPTMTITRFCDVCVWFDYEG